MAADEVEICNLAFDIIGGALDAMTISDITDATDKNSVLCSRNYDPSRKEVLKRMKPQECVEYEDLGSESTDTPEMAEWLYIFDLPDDYLTLVKQTDEQYHKLDYDCEVKGNYLFTNALSNEDGDSAYIEYVVDEETVTVFSDEVVKAIATLLATKLIPKLVTGEWGYKRRQELLDEFEKLVMPLAKGINRQQQHHEEDERESKYSVLGDRYEYT